MVIKSSSAREVDRLVGELRDGSPVQRDAAIARLRVIGARALDRLAALVRSDAPAVAQAAALKALEGIADPRARDTALDSLAARTPAVAAAAIAALRPWLASDARVLDAVTALALDRGRSATVRLAALDALSELPRSTIQPVLRQIGGDDPSLAAQANGETLSSALDQPSGVMHWLALRGAQAPLSEVHNTIVRLRERERDEPSARRRQEWRVVRAAAHRVLAERGSRVALYDLREAFDAADAPLPLDFLTAVTRIGDSSCLDPLARAWAAAEKEPWWRDRLAEAARAIVTRQRLTGRQALVRRIRSRFPGLL